MKTRLLIVFTILTFPLLIQSVHSLEIDTSSYSLKQQIKEGWDIESLFCHNDQVLILKITDESPACVNPETKEKLLERGWAILTPKERLYDIEKTLNDKDCLEFGRWLDEFVDGNFNENNLIFDLPVSDELSQRIYDFIPYCIDNDGDGSFYLNTKHLELDVKLQVEKAKSLSDLLDKMTLWVDPFFDNLNKFAEINEKKDTRCFTTPSMNYFCYAKPRMVEEGDGVSYLFSNTTKITGEIHFDNVNVGPSYFTIKNMTQIKGDTASITFADNDYRVGNATSTLYEITDEFEFTEIIEKFDTFVAKCDNYDGTSVTVVQYLGITTIDGVDYFMTWHLNAHSEEGITCDYPQIIQNSFDNDFGNIGYEWSASYYPNKRPLPNGTFDYNLENVIPWLMMQELETRGIENWKNDPSTGAHTDEGWSNPSKMCSSLFVDGETKLYISTSFYSEPELTINEIIINDSKPLDCQKWFGIPYGVDSKTGNLLYVYDENAQYLVEQLFMDALKETNDDNLQVMTLVVIKSKNNEPQYDNYCGFAHLENQEVWFDADFAENRIIRAAFVDPPSPYCADSDHSCFCDLQEKLTGERKSYEEFFREHVSETCPIIPIPEDDNGLSFDPTKCEWIENEN